MYTTTFYYPFSDKVCARDIDSALYLEVLCLNLGHKDYAFSWFSSVPPGKRQDRTLIQSMLITLLSGLLLTNPFTMWYYTVWATDSNTEEIHKHYIDRYTKQEQQNQEVENEWHLFSTTLTKPKKKLKMGRNVQRSEEGVNSRYFHCSMNWD
jgi:hypothetical protein